MVVVTVRPRDDAAVFGCSCWWLIQHAWLIASHSDTLRHRRRVADRRLGSRTTLRHEIVSFRTAMLTLMPDYGNEPIIFCWRWPDIFYVNVAERAAFSAMSAWMKFEYWRFLASICSCIGVTATQIMLLDVPSLIAVKWRLDFVWGDEACHMSISSSELNTKCIHYPNVLDKWWRS